MRLNLFGLRLYVVVIWTTDSFLFSLSENELISECELILNRAGVSCTKEEQMEMVICLNIASN